MKFRDIRRILNDSGSVINNAPIDKACLFAWTGGLLFCAGVWFFVGYMFTFLGM